MKQDNYAHREHSPCVLSFITRAQRQNGYIFYRNDLLCESIKQRLENSVFCRLRRSPTIARLASTTVSLAVKTVHDSV